MDCTNKIHVVYDDGLLGLNGQDYQYLFSYEKGGLESMRFNGKEWLLGARNRYALRMAGHQSPRQIVRDGTAGGREFTVNSL